MTLGGPLRVSAVIEAGTGLALLLLPRLPLALLFGSTPVTQTGLIFLRFIGAALLSLGMACWWAAYDSASRASAGVVKAMLLYDALAIALLVYAGMSGLSGIGLWPAVALHAAMAVWCTAGVLGINSNP